MTANVLIVGSVNIDLVVTCAHLPGPGETVVGPRVAHHGGGKGANAAVAAARSGAQVRFCGPVGADHWGSQALADLSSEGIDIVDAVTLDDVPTGTALIVVDKKGENQIAVGAGANAALGPAAVRAAVERAVGWTKWILVSSEIPLPTVEEVLRTASDQGLRCVLNPAPVDAAMQELLELGPLLTPNESELVDLYNLLKGKKNASVEEMAVLLSKRTNAPVVVTLGSDGALVCEDGRVKRVAADKIQDVKDTTGAGDTFNGVFISTLACGASLLEATRRGVAAASLSVGSGGARSGMPFAVMIDAALHF